MILDPKEHIFHCTYYIALSPFSLATTLASGSSWRGLTGGAEQALIFIYINSSLNLFLHVYNFEDFRVLQAQTRLFASSFRAAHSGCDGLGRVGLVWMGFILR